jgi:hypothetical protein
LAAKVIAGAAAAGSKAIGGGGLEVGRGWERRHWFSRAPALVRSSADKKSDRFLFAVLLLGPTECRGPVGDQAWAVVVAAQAQPNGAATASLRRRGREGEAGTFGSCAHTWALCDRIATNLPTMGSAPASV